MQKNINFNKKLKINSSTIILGAFTLALIIGFFFVPVNSENNSDKNYTFKAKALEVNNDGIIFAGSFPRGGQEIKLKALSGRYKNEVGQAFSQLNGQPEFDVFIEEGDVFIAAVRGNPETLAETNAVAVEHYRVPGLVGLAIFFVVLLLIFAKSVGVKAIFSFAASMFIIIRVLIPALLKGVNPGLLITGVILVLAALIIFSVAGFTRKGSAAFLGTAAGLLITTAITYITGSLIKASGLTMPYAGYLVSIGYFDLNMTEILYGAVILGASGAAMDIAMDISASMSEIFDKKPDIKRREIISSGFNIGKAVIGTMTTTLVLAYSGTFLTLLMIFSDRGTGIYRAVNMKIVSVEIMRTLAGSIGLVIVAPVTAIIAGFILIPGQTTDKLMKKFHLKRPSLPADKSPDNRQ
jgi:uncharacterized membrane protein